MSETLTPGQYALRTGVPVRDLQRAGWRPTDRLCASHGTGYSPGCATCRQVTR